jgi:hypothetical protein
MDNINKTKLDELKEELSDKWDAKIDNAYVDYEGRNHLFDYKLDFNNFLNNLMKILGDK